MLQAEGLIRPEGEPAHAALRIGNADQESRCALAMACLLSMCRSLAAHFHEYADAEPISYLGCDVGGGVTYDRVYPLTTLPITNYEVATWHALHL